MVEAYGLNPAIYSAHLKLHPLLVLSVLVVAEHSLGVWGLLLAGFPFRAFRVLDDRISCFQPVPRRLEFATYLCSGCLGIAVSNACCLSIFHQHLQYLAVSGCGRARSTC